MDKLSNIQIKANYVLLKIEKDIDKLRSGIYIQPAQEDKKKGIANTEARHYNIIGEVLLLPETLIYRGKRLKALQEKTGGKYNDYDIKELQSIVKGSMEYETEMEIAVGDKVWFDYLAHINANTEQKALYIEGYGDCILVDYSRLFIRERNGDRIPLNGYIFIRKSEGTRDLGNDLVLADNVDTTIRNQATVVAIGKHRPSYLSVKYSDIPFKDLKPGDEILYNEGMATPLEYSIHQSEGLEELFKIRLTDVRGLIQDGMVAFDSNPEYDFNLQTATI